MIAAVRDCMIEGYEQIIDTLTLPDPADRHVLAAAIHGGAEVIVTANLEDFPREVLARFGIEAKHPDIFVEELVEHAPARVLDVVVRQAADLVSPPRTTRELLETLRARGLTRTAARLTPLIR